MLKPTLSEVKRLPERKNAVHTRMESDGRRQESPFSGEDENERTRWMPAEMLLGAGQALSADLTLRTLLRPILSLSCLICTDAITQAAMQPPLHLSDYNWAIKDTLRHMGARSNIL